MMNKFLIKVNTKLWTNLKNRKETSHYPSKIRICQVKETCHTPSWNTLQIFPATVWLPFSKTHINTVLLTACAFPLLFLTSLKIGQQSVWIFLPHSYVFATSFSKAFVTQTISSSSPFFCHVKHFCNAAKERNVIFTCCPMSCCALISKLPCWVAFISPAKWQNRCL